MLDGAKKSKHYQTQYKFDIGVARFIKSADQYGSSVIKKLQLGYRKIKDKNRKTGQEGKKERLKVS